MILLSHAATRTCLIAQVDRLLAASNAVERDEDCGFGLQRAMAQELHFIFAVVRQTSVLSR